MGLRDILGQDGAVKGLRHAFLKEHVSHAYLFEGPDGVGKCTTALAFAELLLCEAPQGADACGICNSCRMFRAGSHPDFITIVPDGKSIKIKQIRELRDRLSVASRQGGYTVVLMEDADTMGIEAANALLKTIEEPQGPSVFLLLAESDKLPKTILSRVQRLYFRPLSEGVMTTLLEGMGDSERMQLAIGLSEGSMTRALSLIEDEEAWNALTEQKQALEATMEDLSTLHSGDILRYCNAFMGKGEEVREQVVLIRRYLSEQLHLALQSGRDMAPLLAQFRDTALALEQLTTNTEPAFILGALFLRMAEHSRR